MLAIGIIPAYAAVVWTGEIHGGETVLALCLINK
jgi:hypothetical protein